MARFSFEAPDLFAPGAALSGLRSPEVRQRRLMRWLRDRLAAQGVDAFGPVADAEGWRLAVNAEDGFVSIRLAPHGGGDRPFTVIVDLSGEADDEYDDTVAACEHALSGRGDVALVVCDLTA